MAEGFTVSGSVDPTTLYTKQQCIGRRARSPVPGVVLTECRWGQLWKGVQRVCAVCSYMVCAMR